MAQLPQINQLRSPVSPKRTSKGSSSGFLSTLNLPFLVVVALLAGYGLLICWSAVQGSDDYNFSRQLAGVVVGIGLLIGFTFYDYRRLAHASTLFLVINVILILSPHLPVIGVTTMGATSWVKIGMQFQPGEFAKITVVLFAASLVARYGGKLDDLREYLKVLILLSIPFLCIMTQPDLGTGLVYLFISAVVLIMGGAKTRYLIATLFVFIGLIALVFALDELLKYQTASGSWEYRLLKQYQRNRLLVFLNPDADTSGSGYNLAQAKIAIGSGGLFGKGLLNATQSTHGFLPEAPTDFIFCVLAEELGYFGVLVLLALYIALIYLSVRIARDSTNLFGMLIVCAIVGMWLFQILENIGMDCGLMPITGIPLPFVSYGSSFMVVNFALLGLIGSVWTHESSANKGGDYAATH